MALSLGSGRRRWSSCRQYVEVQIAAISMSTTTSQASSAHSRLSAGFLLSYLLVPLVLFFAVFAFLVCFGWFTLVYFVSSLLGKCNSHDDLCTNEEQARNQEERAGNSVAEGTGASAMAEDCIEGQQIKEVFVDGFSDASLDLSSMTSSYDCTKDAYDTGKDEEHSSCQKHVERVMAFDSNCKEFNEVSSFDISSVKQQQEDTPVDCFAEEVASRELCTSCGTANLPHLQSGHEFIGNTKEAPACATSEILELIDKHETVAGVVTDSDNSEENRVNCRADFPGDILPNKVPKKIFDEQQDTTENTVTDPINMLSEDHFIEEKGNLIIGISDETHDLNNESKISGLHSIL
jgi:hypothetical protein